MENKNISSNKKTIFEIALVATFVSFSIVFRLIGFYMPLYLSFDIFISCFFVYFLKRHVMALSYLIISSFLWLVLGIAVDVNFAAYTLDYLIPNISCYIIFLFSFFIDKTQSKNFNFKISYWFYFCLSVFIVFIIRTISISLAGALFYSANQDLSLSSFFASFLLNWPNRVLELILVILLLITYKSTHNLKRILFSKYF